MTYNWISYGKTSWPKIAFISPSSGFSGRKGQIIIKSRIQALSDIEICVLVPEYQNGEIVIQPDIQRKKLKNFDSPVFPAVNPEIGAQQIIDAIENSWNILPLMGGLSFASKIDHILKYFEDNPGRRNPNVIFFGYSNATFAAILAAKGICRFISTPFSSIFAKKHIKHYEFQIKQLENILRNQHVEIYPRTIISGKRSLLSKCRTTYHYPVNFGLILEQIEKNQILLQIPDQQSWSLGIEGFLQSRVNLKPLNYAYFISCFLENYTSNLPKFIELGQIATRFDGNFGYEELLYDENGHIIFDDFNIDKISSGSSKLMQDLKTTNETALFIKQQKSLNKQDIRNLEILSLIPFERLLVNSDKFSKADITALIESQNAIYDKTLIEIIKMLEDLDIPLIRNTKNGHCVNMSVVNGGLNEVRIEGDKLLMEMIKDHNH